MKKYEEYGNWWNDYKTELIKKDNRIFALNGWNGEEYIDCWECKDEFDILNENERYCIKPIYKFQEEKIDLSLIEEDSEEWFDALEVVDYDIY